MENVKRPRRSGRASRQGKALREECEPEREVENRASSSEPIQQPKISESEKPVTMLMWVDYKQHMMGTLQDIYCSQQYTDCRLVVSDGEVYANRPILSMASAFFETIFTSMAPVTMDPSTVLIPDMTFANLQLVMQFIYTGRVTLQPTEVVPFMESCGMLQLRGVECQGNRTMGIYIDESFHSHNRDSIIADSDPLELGPETDPLDISVTQQSKTDLKGTKHPLDDGMKNVSSTPDTNEIFLKDIFKGETMLSDEGSADDDSASDTDEDTAMDQSTPCADDPVSSMDYAKELEVVNKNQTEGNYTPYVNCLKRAIVAVISEGLSNRKSSSRYNVPRRKLVRWIEKVKRAMENSPTEMDVRTTVEAIINCSVQKFKYLLNESDANKRAVLLRKPGNSLSYDIRMILAIDDIINHGIALPEACRRYNAHENLVARRMYNLGAKGTHARNSNIVRKKDNPELYESLVSEALAAMATGTLSVGDASQLFRIHRSNLSKLIKKENIRCPRKRSSRRMYDNAFGTASDTAMPPPLVPITQPAPPTPAPSSRMQVSEQIAAPSVSKVVCTPATIPLVATPSLIGLPKLVPLSSNDQGPDYDQRMQSAINAITKLNMSYREASENYRIPKTVLWRSISQMNKKN